ncbi:MAG TPA: tyrosine/phenylalanine carboxypeptidase domain-containing protein, partial [Polyangiaceae bacterium]|nr:tyrosine/phenylalanine carboxypeptidase domain-containing protein [Polyangiaceae bacterium]
SHAGTPTFLELSRQLYGDPYQRLPGTYLTHFEAAQQLLDITAPWASACRGEEQLSCMTAEHVRAELQSRLDPFFAEHPIAVVIDPRLTSKAAAAARRIRIRGRSSFTEADIDQLIEHEAFVHAATALNGRLQPIQAFGLAAPRTTATQEGLATIAELITGSMDLSRLRRLALRIIAVKHVIEGADFVEVFRYFLRAGQSDDESVRSAARVFRGGDPRGHIAFTKDVVYLHGLIGVHTFLRRAIFDSRIELIPRLFAGRVTLGDVLRLDSAFEDGDLLPGRYITHWAADARRLAAHLSFSLILNRIKLENVDLETILERG